MGFGVLFTQGIVTGEPHAMLQEILEQAEAADRLGFDRTRSPPSTSTPTSTSARRCTCPSRSRRAPSRVRVGTAIAIAPLYNPVELAQDAAMLDQLSGGRAWLGLGVGYMPVDYATVGVPWDDRAQRFDETVRIVRWRTRATGSPSPTASTPSTTSRSSPRPAQAGGVPLHLAAWTPGGLRRAGRLGDGWITNALMSLDTMRGWPPTTGPRPPTAGRARPRHLDPVLLAVPIDARRALEKFGDTALAMARTLFDYGAITDLPGVTSADQITLAEFLQRPVRLRHPRGVRRDDPAVPRPRQASTTS